ncbi:hypothetical protein BpHYR1_036254 [Brachionus plicatilis]|uniref:Uncharacterized protein n=1 Tax=Brachionus plicatilis TaxID=10195 RepID=A0A3M7Q1K9_BRAPC|nr:hypothetical protein BpHYR1_036254 [Brachionus plicatilis]
MEDLVRTTEGKVNDTVEYTTEDSEIFTETSEDSDILTESTIVEDLMRTTEGNVNDTAEITTEDSEIFTGGSTLEDLIKTSEEKVNVTEEITTAESLFFTESSPDIELQTFTTISFNDPEISTSFEFLRKTTKNLLETTQNIDLDNTSVFESSFVSDPNTQTFASTTGTKNLSSQTTSDPVNAETIEIDKLTVDFLTTRTSSVVEQKTSDFKITTFNPTQIFATKSEAISIDSTITSEFLASTEISTFEKTKSSEKIETSFQTSTQAETTKLETSNKVTQNTETTTSTDFIDGIVTVPDLGSKMNTTKFSVTIPATTKTMAADMTEITDMVTNSTMPSLVDFLFLIQMRLGNSYLEVINETQAKLSQNLSDYTKKALMENNLVGYESIILLNITESERLAILFSLLKYRANAGENDSQLKQNLETSLKNGDRTILNVASVSVQKYTPSIDKPAELTTAQSELKTNTILAIIFGSVFGALTLFLLDDRVITLVVLLMIIWLESNSNILIEIIYCLLKSFFLIIIVKLTLTQISVISLLQLLNC